MRPTYAANQTRNTIPHSSGQMYVGVCCLLCNFANAVPFCVRSLLGQSLSLDYSPPKLNPGVTSELLEEQSCHLWLNYCLLQELTSEESEASEAYEKSLCHLSQTSDAQKLWIE